MAIYTNFVTGPKCLARRILRKPAGMMELPADLLKPERRNPERQFGAI
jgi:hypothetical protein